MDSKEKRLSILMLPWLAHGHISPFLELSKRLAKRNFHIYLCSTPINLIPLRKTLPTNILSSIELIDIHFPSSSVLPSHFQTTKDLPPHLMSTLKSAFDSAKLPFSNILKSLKPNLVIYDFLQPWSAEAAREENIEAVVFFTYSPVSCAFLFHFTMNPGLEYPFPLFNFPEIERRKIVAFMYDTANGLTDKERFLECIRKSSDFILMKNIKSDVEEKYIEHFSTLVEKKIVPVGPLVQELGDESVDDVVLMEWLSKKEPASTVFVSFGSEYFLSKEEREEIAYGLEHSKVNFIWVVRFHGGEKIRLREALPEGFQERIGDKGMIVEGWAPQGKILRHSSIGGFVSHCGWSSTLEGVRFGVPIVAMPMHLDQPLNAKFLVEMGVGLEVKRENGKYKREEIARVIRNVVEQKEGKEVRIKIREMSERIREKCDEELDLVVEKLLQLTLAGES